MYMERNMYKEKIVNVKTGEETWRDYTAEEIAEVEKAKAEAAAKATEAAEKEAARKAIFDKLGITEEEAKLLLGGI
jgi:hypothetical protein